jgi:uncharacterized protein YjdB
VTFYNSTGAQLGVADTYPVEGTTEWKQYQTVAKAPASAVTAKVSCYYDTGTGTAWFDDLELAQVVPVEGMEITASRDILEVGENLELQLEVVPQLSLYPSVNWYSTDPGVAAVENGTVTGVGGGYAVIMVQGWDTAFNQPVSAQFRLRIVDPQVNVLSNGDFESFSNEQGSGQSATPLYWNTAGPAGVAIDSAFHKMGSRSLRIDGQAGVVGSVYQQVEVEPGQMYRFTQYVRTGEPAQEGQPATRLTFRNEHGDVAGTPWQSPVIAETGVWQFIEAMIPSPMEAVTLSVENSNDGMGTIWFDTAILEPYIPVMDIAAVHNTISVLAGESMLLQPVVLPSHASVRELTWSTSNSQVVEVSSGFIQATGLGTAQVTAYAENGTVWETYTITVEAPGLLANGSFEETLPASAGDKWTGVKAAGWASPWLASGNPEVTVTHDVAHEGGHALRISASSSAKATAGQKSIPVTEGLIYKFGGWVKTENITGAAFIRVYFYDASGIQISAVDTAKLAGTKEWALLQKTIAAPAGAASVQFTNYYDTGSGIAWFDDTFMKQVIPAETLTFQSQLGAVAPGEAISVEPVFVPWNTTERQLDWTSSNPLIAVVENGSITGIAPGTAIIEASAREGGLGARFLASVTDTPGTLQTENVAVQTSEGAAFHGFFPSADEQGRPLSYYWLNSPGAGVLHLKEDGQWSYYSQDGQSGQDSFTVGVADSTGKLGMFSVLLTILPVNHAPASEPAIVSTEKNTPVSGFINAVDQDGDPLIYTLSESPAHGSVAVSSDGTWVYLPEADYVGHDSFSIRITDGRGGEAFAEATVMTRMSMAEITAVLEERNQNGRQPRLLAGAADFERIRQLTATDANMAGWYSLIKSSADQLLTEPASYYELRDGVRLLMVSRDVLERVKTLAMVYLISGDQVYAERAWDELAAAAAFPDWHPAHFLDTAEMTAAAAIGYDWLYDYLTAERRSILRSAIVEKGLMAARPFYQGKLDWTRRINNWNAVCNGGIGLGALAIAGDDPALEPLIAEIIAGSMESLPIMLREYAPDGGWPEGPMYWEYGSSYLVYYLSSLEQSLGSDMGLSSMPGLADTVLFPIYMTGTTGAFNFSDADAGYVVSPIVQWLADRFDDNRYIWFYKQMAGRKNGGVLDMLWYQPERYAAAREPEELEHSFSYVEAASMRSAWNDTQAAYVSFKVGDNQAPHGDLDIGSFVFDALGVRWFSDFGTENYNLPGYWDYSANGTRWNYYRKRAEAHNTLVINPHTGPDQNPLARAELGPVSSGAHDAWSVIDMTPAYSQDILSAKRGFRLDKKRMELVIQDEIISKAESDIRWQVHTQANVTVAADGKSAILHFRDRRLYLEIGSPSRGVFYTADALPLVSSPNPAGQKSNSGYKTLGIRLEHSLNETITVRMVPLMPGQTIQKSSAPIVPLEQWEVSDQERAVLSGIKLEGIPLANFQSGKMVYEVTLPQGAQSVPVITAATEQPGVVVHVSTPPSLPGAAVITAEAQDGSMVKSNYYVQLSVRPLLGLPEDGQILPVSSVSASAVDQAYIPELTLDGSLEAESRWSSSTGNWIQYDLGENRTLKGIALAFMRGNQRKTYFEVLASADAHTWHSVMQTASTGETLGYEYYEWGELEARYIRIVGYGNADNNFTSITEAALLGASVQP